MLGNESNRTLYTVIRVASKYTQSFWLMAGSSYVRVPGKVSKSADSFNSERVEEKVFFLTQVFNLTGQKRLRTSNSECACAMAKKVWNVERNLYGGRSGLHHAKGWSRAFPSFYLFIHFFFQTDFEINYISLTVQTHFYKLYDSCFPFILPLVFTTWFLIIIL